MGHEPKLFSVKFHGIFNDIPSASRFFRRHSRKNNPQRGGEKKGDFLNHALSLSI
jgi:hypothetical protein